MMKSNNPCRSLTLCVLFIILCSTTQVDGFTVTPSWSRANIPSKTRSTIWSTTTTSTTELELTPPQTRVCDFLTQIHKSDLEFRVVVVGNGAILETTSKLGPTCKVSGSPTTGEPLMTLASADQSFEFHVKLGQVSKISLSEKQKQPNSDQVMRVMRFLTDTGTPMCSLICSSHDAADWFHAMMEQHGTEIQL